MPRGGKRIGAGRNREGEPRIQMTVTVKASTRDTLREMRAEGRYIGRVLDDIALAWRSGYDTVQLRNKEDEL